MSGEDKVTELVKPPSEESRPEEPNVVAHPRKSGWGCPWHPFQLIAWFFIVFFTCAHYGFLVFYIPGLWRIFGYIIPGAVLLIHVIFNFAATYVDAAEETVRKKFKSGRHLRPLFNSARHKHVIENMYCNLCQVNVTAKAKHCRICDKCVRDFDHHCIWLNNCIGKRNYRLFLGTVFSALVGTVLLLLINLAYFILYFAHRDSLRYDCPHPSNVSACDPTLRVLGLAVPDPVFPTLTAILGALALLGVLLLGHLFLFHVYLFCKGMSTYDYIFRDRVEKESRKERMKRKDQLAVGYHGRCSCLRRKLNRVQPIDEEKCNGRRDDCSGRGSDNDSVSLGSIHSNASDGMATFGRTPPPSDGSGGSGDSPNEQGLRSVTAWVYKEDGRNSNANNNAEKKEPVLILRKPTKKCKEPDTTATATPLVVSTATETVITMEVLSASSAIAGVGQAPSGPPVTASHLQPAVSAACRVGGANSKRAKVFIDDEVETSCLAAMTAGYDDDEYGYERVKETSVMAEEPGSTLAAMAGTWGAEETPGERPGLLKTDVERMALSEGIVTPSHGIPHRESRSSSMELQPSLEKIENVSSYGTLTGHDLASCPLPSPVPDPDVAGTADRGSSPIQFPGNYLLQELTLPELRDLSKGILRSPSPDDSDDETKMDFGRIAKNVSFEDPSISGIRSLPFSPQSIHPLPPLTPISDPLTSPDTRAPPRALQRSRPLPPIHMQHCGEHVGSKDSLLSGSTNSLPPPDPRYQRKGLLPKLGASDLTLEKKGKGTGVTNSKKGKGKMKLSHPAELHECEPGSKYGHGYMAQGYVHCVASDSSDSLSPIPRPAGPIPEPKAYISPSPSLDADAAVWWAGTSI